MYSGNKHEEPVGFLLPTVRYVKSREEQRRKTKEELGVYGIEENGDFRTPLGEIMIRPTKNRKMGEPKDVMVSRVLDSTFVSWDSPPSLPSRLGSPVDKDSSWSIDGFVHSQVGRV